MRRTTRWKSWCQYVTAQRAAVKGDRLDGECSIHLQDAPSARSALQGAPLRAVGPGALRGDARERWYSSRAEPFELPGNPSSDRQSDRNRRTAIRRGDRIIFDGLDLVVPRGSITALMGPSGTGKTTLLQIIGGQIRPDSGRVIVDGHDVPKLSRDELFELRRNMGMLFQSSALFTDISVFENVAFPLRAHTNLPDEMIRDLVLMKLNAVGLRGARDLMPSQLSGGMSRRVALARTIALDPQVHHVRRTVHRVRIRSRWACWCR